MTSAQVSLAKGRGWLNAHGLVDFVILCNPFLTSSTPFVSLMWKELQALALNATPLLISCSTLSSKTTQPYPASTTYNPLTAQGSH